MASFAAAPPNTHAGGDDEALRTHGTIPMNDPPVYADERVNMEEYKNSVPWWKRVYQDSFTQMLLLSMQSFCGPAMADAIAGVLTSISWLRTCGSLTINRSRRWWSCFGSDKQHRQRYQLRYARTGMLLRRSSCQQARCQVVVGHRSHVFPYPRIVILLQQQVWQSMGRHYI